jgi:hypothetical protein
MNKTITQDANLNQPIGSTGSQARHDGLVTQAAKDQEYARTTVIDGRDRVPQLKKISMTVADPNSSIKERVTADYPGKGDFDKHPTKELQGFRKEPTKFVHGME